MIVVIAVQTSRFVIAVRLIPGKWMDRGRLVNLIPSDLERLSTDEVIQHPDEEHSRTTQVTRTE
jgi:hypothetical protein